MHAIKPATVKAGVRLEDLPGPRPSDAVQASASRLIRGRALIFWDPRLPGTKYAKKRDAIDTDQITPAADCVSESLETLDERWKAGSFRYLMPDFRERVHRGETFVIAGDRFAIGSSREMSPAGLKGIAEEAGLEMVVICGQNMGDIFRRNALNLGLHVVQSPEAVADARDGDEFTFDPVPRRIANDHFVFTGRDDDDKQTGIGRAFATHHRLVKPYYATPGDGIFHFYFPEQGLVMPGQYIPGADSHSRAYGAYGAVGMGVGSTTLGFGWSTGYVYFTLAKSRRVVLTGRLQAWVGGQDIVLELLRRWGAQQSQGMSVELVDAAKQLPIVYRNTIANMMAEAEALNGIFAPDEITYAWYRAKGIRELPYPPFAPGADAVYAIDETIDLAGVMPMIAKPFSPGNAFPAEAVARERLAFDKAMIGSCTNGSYDDLLAAALVIRAARKQGATKTA